MKATSDPIFHWKRIIGAALVALATVLVPSAAAAAGRVHPINVTAMPIGRPVWQPLDFHMFAAPVGTAESGYVEFFETMTRLLPPPNHAADPYLGIGPGIAHARPYVYELGENVERMHLQERFRYTPSDFSRGTGVWLAWMNVPVPGEIGTSPDFAAGPVIPNRLFPIHVSGTDVHNGRKFSLLADFEVPPLDAAIGARYADMDGHSHFPLFIADNADFGPPGTPLAGIYSYVITMMDTSAQGWFVHAQFVIVP